MSGYLRVSSSLVLLICAVFSKSRFGAFREGFVTMLGTVALFVAVAGAGFAPGFVTDGFVASSQTQAQGVGSTTTVAAAIVPL